MATLFETAFPAAQILRGSMWRGVDSSAPYENDLLICLDSYLIVVESKSGKVDAAAKRGGDRLKKTLAKLIVGRQSKLIASLASLSKTLGHTSSTLNEGLGNQCDTSAAKRVIRLNVTLELAALCLRKGQFSEGESHRG